MKFIVRAFALIGLLLFYTHNVRAENPAPRPTATLLAPPAPTRSSQASQSQPQSDSSKYLRSIRIPSLNDRETLGALPTATRSAALKESLPGKQHRARSPFDSSFRKSAPTSQKSRGPLTGDDTSDPYIISSLPFFEQNTTSGFTDDYSISCEWGPSSAPDVVYYYLSDHEQFITIELCNSSYDTKLGVSPFSDPGTTFACNDDACGDNGYRSQIQSLHLNNGEEIAIIVDGYDTESGPYEISIWEIGGDDEGDPIVIPSVPYHTTYTTESKWNDYDEPCLDSSESPDVVFYFEPQNDMEVTIDLCNSSYDTKVFVYEGFVDPGNAYACNDDNVACTQDQFRSFIECLPLTAYTGYYIVVDGWGSQSGPFELDIQECAVVCWEGCVPEATVEAEECGYLGDDTTNGGCSGDGKVYLIQPGEIVCGTVTITDFTFDTDWYARYLYEGDSVTWCVTANLPFEAGIMDVTFGCSFFSQFGNGFSCDTVYLGMKVESDGFYAFVVQAAFGFGEWPCEGNPQYQAELIVDPLCKWGGCPIVSIPENEGCDEQVPDLFNGGCYSNPPSFFDIPDNQYVCGLSWRTVDNWDEDVYRRHTLPGDTVTFAVQADFPATVYIYDLGSGCEYNNVVMYAETSPCEIVTLQASPGSETDLVCVVFPTDRYNIYPCSYGPWEYAIICNATSACPEFACPIDATIEQEGCEITAFQGYNAGCNSIPPTFAFVNYDETVCGTSWYGTVGYSFWRDTDWHDANIADGDSVVWCVSAEFDVDAFIIDVSPDCDFDSNVTVVYDTAYACDTVYLSTRKQPGQSLKFALAPRFVTPWLWCELGEWNWEATLIKVDEGCACDCAHDPVCDSTIDIFDVTQVVNVAFRNAAAIIDPNALCPWETTDVNCDGSTDIFDVTKFVNVAFRNANPATEFCDPCAIIGDLR